MCFLRPRRNGGGKPNKSWRIYEPEFYADYEKAQAGSKLYKALCDLVFDDPSQNGF
jgi:hypothetical protein